MTINTAYHQLLYQLFALYDDREAANIADWVIEYITGQRRIERILYKDLQLNNSQQQQLETFTQQLLQYKPVQYVLQEAWFAGMKFFVKEGVLIPRPETDELVEQISNFKFQVSGSLQILDIGTGSGCIPIALKKRLPASNILSIDISEAALAIAQKNATDLQADITLQQLDFLDETNWYQLGKFDIIVSNPPYIKQSESASMSKHVTDYEPSLALFVADNKGLIFYDKIAAFGKEHLNPNGQIFVEINEALGEETVAMFQQHGYQTLLKQDLQGKDRMIQAWLSNDFND
ncbi:peptide chain release factor N(5)-glutamine methyltransferase [Parasediminibacterium paludis]|uniref:peptide chain release factor N(5)-glutamine methyltransferase n=1 Tax=Parasediminibacterium paludis TaxID=908966 RepID=A0ABV8PU68_9BACT